MSYQTKSNTLRILHSYNWSNQFIEKPKSKQSIYTKMLYQNIKVYLTSVFYNFDNDFNTNKTQISLGSLSFTSYFGGLVIYINFFFDLKSSTQSQINKFKIKIKQAKDYLTKILDIKITIILNNFYMFLWKYELYNKCSDTNSLIAIKKAQQTNTYYNIETDYFRFLKGTFEHTIKRHGFYAKNQFFNRIMQPIFILFHYKNLDCKIISNIIAYELGLLRKGHKIFLLFVKNIISDFYQKSKKNIKGIKITIKGRLTLQNRQTRRKQKKIILLGTLHNSKRNMYITESSSLSHNRFGLINVNFAYSYNKQLKLKNIKHENKTNDIESIVYNNYKFKNNRLMLENMFKNKRLIISYFFLLPFLKNRLNIQTITKKFIMETSFLKTKTISRATNLKILKTFILNFKH